MLEASQKSEITKANEITSKKFKPTGDCHHGVSVIPMRSILKQVGKTISCKQFRLSLVAHCFAIEREKTGTNWEKWSKSGCSVV